MSDDSVGSPESRLFRSEAVDDDFTIRIASCGEDPRSTLVVTDADGLFGLTVDTVRLMQLPGLVPALDVVGIGYPGAASIVDTVQIRARDLTPTHSTIFERSGGGDRFAAFLESELVPWLRLRSPQATDDLLYFGHSLGGLFGTYLMLTRPHLFDRYILSSPSLWWDRGMIFEVARTGSLRDADSVAAFFGIGGLETDDGRRLESAALPEDHPDKPPAAHLDMVDDMERFVAELGRNHPNLDLGATVLPDEYHTTVPGVVLSRALRHFHESRA